MSRKRRRHAFTLLELMIVLVILVLLFAMVGPRLLGSQKKADIKAARTQIGNLEAALELYAVDMRSFPATEDGMAALLQPPSDERQARKWDGPYLDDDVLPLDPWDNPYEYVYPPEHNKRDFPDIWSLGPDGEADTDDDIVNWRVGSGEDGTQDELGSGQSDLGGSDMGGSSRSPMGGGSTGGRTGGSSGSGGTGGGGGGNF